MPIPPTVRAASTTHAGQRDEAPGTAVRTKRRVLAVDDDLNVCAMLVSALTAEGYDVDVTATAEAALESLARRLPDIVLLDVMLGAGDDGLELLSQIRHTWTLPVVLLTGPRG